MNIKRGYTIIPNEVLSASQLSIGARYLYCLLLRYAGQEKDYCYPGQKRLANIMGVTPRHIRNLLKELTKAKVVKKKRQMNKPNYYFPCKTPKLTEDYISFSEGNVDPIREELEFRQ